MTARITLQPLIEIVEGDRELVVRLVDERVLAENPKTLAELGEDVLVAFTADHGEALLDVLAFFR